MLAWCPAAVENKKNTSKNMAQFHFDPEIPFY